MTPTAKMIEVIRRIPKGKVMTYGDVAYVAGFPLCARVVGAALNKSPDLPWERVVGADGKILRPGILGQEQRLRLEQQGVEFIGLRVDMKRFRCMFKEVAGA
ncbi:MAG TPA: MGMT family protein [Candidatus Angelobacter sp.]|jgi:methylated-DNA-protein-cysteine methyltransferase-like protein|nr:MGMT family protein [Candidatus Angelobacter sp.]